MSGWNPICNEEAETPVLQALAYGCYFRLRLRDDFVQMRFAPKALRVELADIFRAGRPGRKPACARSYFQPSDRSAIAWRGGQLVCDRVACQRGRLNVRRRQLCQRDLLRGRGRSVDTG